MVFNYYERMQVSIRAFSKQMMFTTYGQVDLKVIIEDLEKHSILTLNKSVF